MPRTILGPIDGNRRFNHELSPYERGKIVGAVRDAYQALYTAMKEGWKTSPQEEIDNLINGIDRMVEACRLAKGWHTTY